MVIGNLSAGRTRCYGAQHRCRYVLLHLSNPCGYRFQELLLSLGFGKALYLFIVCR